jgi:hypothetical protein
MLSAEPQFANRKRMPVSAATCIAFEDYYRCRTIERRSPKILPVPEWAVDNRKLQLLIARYWEIRAGFRIPNPGTPSERLAVAQERILERLADREATLEEMFHNLAVETDPERRRILQREVRSLDMHIVTDRRGPGVVATVVYKYFRLDYRSHELAFDIGISPQNARQFIHRLRLLWRKMQSGTDATLVMSPAATGL